MRSLSRARIASGRPPAIGESFSKRARNPKLGFYGYATVVKRTARVIRQIQVLVFQFYDLISRPSASLIRELSMAGNPLLAAPPVQLMTSPG